MPRQCPVCSHPRGPEVLRKVFEGQLTLRDAARELGVSYPYIWRCYNYHFKVRASDKGVDLIPRDDEEIEEIEYAEELKQLIHKLKRKVNEVLDDPSIRDRPTAWIRQFRGVIRDLAELEGRLQKAPLIQLTQYNIRFEQLTAFLMKDLCDNCKRKAIKFLEELSKQPALE